MTAPVVLCACGCGLPAPIAKRTDSRHGYVKGQPVEFINHHATRVRVYTPKPVTDRIRRSVAIDENGCWNWLLSVHPRTGYGSVGVAGKWVGAHRASYEAFVGPIPEGLHIDHLCRNRRCVNPEHLEPVTVKENLDRSPLTPQARETCPRNHPYDEKNTYVTKRGWRKCRRCEADRVAERRTLAGASS